MPPVAGHGEEEHHAQEPDKTRTQHHACQQHTDEFFRFGIFKPDHAGINNQAQPHRPDAEPHRLQKSGNTAQKAGKGDIGRYVDERLVQECERHKHHKQDDEQATGDVHGRTHRVVPLTYMLEHAFQHKKEHIHAVSPRRAARQSRQRQSPTPAR